LDVQDDSGEPSVDARHRKNTITGDRVWYLRMNPMSERMEEMVLNDIEHRFRGIKSISDRALEQVEGEELFIMIDEGSNSIAVLMKHMAGNMLHNWGDPFTPGEEKPERNRDSEFIIEAGDTEEAIRGRWEEGWRTLFEALGGFEGEDLTRTVRIMWRDYTLMQALSRQIVHYSLHAGQIVLLAKHIRGEEWRTLSIPRGQSKEYDERLRRERMG
jgi:hypothetical protein